jgi:hypothetical protein
MKITVTSKAKKKKNFELFSSTFETVTEIYTTENSDHFLNCIILCVQTEELKQNGVC